MAKHRTGFTKQGVRDLNGLPSKPRGRMVRPEDFPGAYARCSHRNTHENYMGEKCNDCGTYVRVFPDPYDIYLY